MAKKLDPETILSQWLELDLTRAAKQGALQPAWETDDVIDQVKGVLAAGRCPIITGPPGIGKTAAVHEFVRRGFTDKRVLQLSLQFHASGLKKPQEEMRPAMHALLGALKSMEENVFLFFRDMQLSYNYDIEAQFITLGERFSGRLIAEGHPAMVDMVLEQEAQLEQLYQPLPMDEPSLEKTYLILEQWSGFQAKRKDKKIRFSKGAVEQTLHLTHRFLSRSRQPRKSLDLLRQLEAFCKTGKVTDAHVFDCFCRNHNTPRFLVDPKIALDLGDLERTFSHSLLGQRDAIRPIVQRIGMIKAGLADMRRPFGAFLFAGPTGVGKTLLAQLLAETLFGSKDHMVRINMADYQQEQSTVTLFGDPDGNYISQRRGLLSRRLQGRPLGVLLLDEIEKANAKALDSFLQLIDEGCFINGAGELISCRSIIIIATTNAGAEVYRGESFGFAGPEDLQTRQREASRRLEDAFRIEFLNRFDQVVQFKPLSRENIRTIALRELEKIKERSGFRQRKLSLQIDEAVLDWLAANGFDPDYGARFLRRTMERHVTTAIAETIVRENPGSGASIAITVRRNRIRTKLAAEEEVTIKEPLSLPVGKDDKRYKLDQEGLLKESENILTSAAGLMAGLRAKKQERSGMLKKMNEPGFWERGEARREVLDRFRELDVAIRAEDRLATHILHLEELKTETGITAKDLKRKALLVEKAALRLRDWRDRLAEEGGSSVWLVIMSSDPLKPVEAWVEELAKMELSWCKKLGLSAEVAAFELLDEKLRRVALDIEGPGAEVYLAMEQGSHRRCRKGKPDLRAQMEVIPKSEKPHEEWPHLLSVAGAQSKFKIKPQYSGVLELENRGLTLELFSGNRDMLNHLLFDLSLAWKTGFQEKVLAARTYGEHGQGASDPRTGVSVPRIKDVLKGNLNRFLDGWRGKVKS